MRCDFFDHENQPHFAEYCFDSNSQQDDLHRFSVYLKFFGASIYEKNNQYEIHLPKNFKFAFFEKRFEAFQQTVSQLTLESFSNDINAYNLKKMIDQNYSYVIYDEEKYCKTFCEFVRGLSSDAQVLYIGGIVSYK